MNTVPGRHPKVFIAYAQDSQAHKDAVRSLADLLRSYGVDAEIDQYAEEERQDGTSGRTACSWRPTSSSSWPPRG